MRTSRRSRVAAIAAVAASVVSISAVPARGERYDFSVEGKVTPRGGPSMSAPRLPPVPPLGIAPRVPDVGYTDLYQGVDVVIEAPWRVQVRDASSYVPLLLFVPDARYPDLVNLRDPILGGRAPRVTVPGPLKRTALHLRDVVVDVIEAGRARTVYRERHPGAPSASFEVVDELGARRTRIFDPPTVSADWNEGWHRILRLPVTALGSAAIRAPRSVELEVRFVYDRHYDRDSAPGLRHRKRLRVTLSGDPLPSPGAGWIALDAHHHTVAEYTRKTHPTAPRKAFGSPIEMVKEALYALGMVGARPGDQRLDRDHPAIATDHNTFFSDDDTIMVGPTSAAGVARLAYQPEEDFAGLPPVARAEFERMRATLGEAAGQEVTLKGPKFGHHLLAYRTRHFAGAWHGGCLSATDAIAVVKTLFHFFRNSKDCPRPKLVEDHNDNDLETVLAAMAATPWFPRGFAYASHPMNCDISWTADMLRTSAFDPGRGASAGGRDRFVRDPRRWNTAGPREFVFKGLQVWNLRSTFLIEGKLNFLTDIDFYDLDPFRKGGWRPIRPKASDPDGNESLACDERPRGDPWWELHRGLLAWHRLIREGMQFRLDTEPDVVFIRKVYAVAGTDAHGDFNYETAIPGTFFHDDYHTDWGWTVSNNAFGLVRTYVQLDPNDGRSVVTRALDALARGNSVLTDGPVVSFELDAEPRFHSATLTWRDGGTPFDADGEIGGGPGSVKRVVGAFDGGRTMLVRRGATPHIRYRWSNTPEFGGGPLKLTLSWNSIADREPGRLADLFRPLRAAAEAIGAETEPLSRAVTGTTAVALSALTARVQDPRLGDDEPHRAYTNPVWIVPVDVTCRGGAAGPDGRIPARGVVLTFSFPISMSGQSQAGRLDPIGTDGVSRAVEGMALISSVPGATGWSTTGSPRYTLYTVTNEHSVKPGRFVAYLGDPRDYHGNGLNPLSASVDIASGVCTVR